MESVKTALRVLEAVAESQPVGVSDLARKLGEPKTTIQRSLVTLGEMGWLRAIEKDPKSGRRAWVLTPKMLTLGRQLQSNPRLRDIALPVMSRLQKETEETIDLAIPDGRTVMLIELLSSPQPLRVSRAVGAHAPMHVLASGLAILAFLPEAQQKTYLSVPLEAWTPKTITSPDALSRELKKIRKRGYALSKGDMVEGLHGVGAPILNSDGQPIASVALSGPSTRLTDEKFPAYGAMLCEAAEEIGGALAAS